MSRRRQRNRRFFEREQLLDVRLRTDPVRASRLRLLGIGIAVVFSLLVVGFALWHGGRLFLDRCIYNNPAFAIRHIEVQTDGIISGDAIRSWAMVKPGENLLALDLMRVKRDLELQPCIQAVAVERLLPRTLKLRVSEREPIAQTLVMQPRPDGSYEQVVFHFDEAGYAMKPLDPKYQAQQPPVSTEHLPMLLGVQVNELEPGVRVESAQIRGALALLVEFDRSLMAGFADLQRINVSSPEILQVTTSQGAEITFSLNQFDVQLRRWRIIYDQYQKWGKAIATLDLSISNNLPLRWIAASAIQPITPKAVKPPRTKKKNV